MNLIKSTNKIIGFKQSRASLENYFAWRVSRVRDAVNKIQKLKSLKGLRVLDVGFGYGALCSVLLESGAQVVGVEIDEGKFEIASKKFLKNKKNLKLIKVTNEKLPFKDNSFDAIFLFDVIEHINKPKITIDECDRLLKPGGLMYVEFSPYYSITGHHLYDFTVLPIHVLPKKYIKKIVYSKKINGYFDNDYFWNQFESCNKLKISEFQRLVKNFQKIEERFSIKYPELFEINLPFMNLIGPFKDFFTMGFSGIYSKEDKRNSLKQVR